MDAIDRSILELLVKNSRSSASDISRAVNLSLPAVAERIRKLEEGGVIEQYTAKLNRAKLGLGLLAFVFVNLEKTEHIAPFRAKIVLCPSVLECHHMAGEYDYLLKVLVADTQALDDFLSHTLKSIAGVSKTNTVIALSTLKEAVNP